MRTDKVIVLVVALAFMLSGVFYITHLIDAATEPALGRLAHAVAQLPEHQAHYLDPATDTLPETAERLTLACHRLGVKVLAEPADQGNAGQMAIEEREMQLGSGLSPDERTMTMAHELAHLLEPMALTGFEKDTFAEAVAYLVTLREADKMEPFARYIAQNKLTLPVLTLYRTEIEFAAEVIAGPQQ
jgi:hypothetical protein